MSMQTLTWDVDAAAVAGNSDAYTALLWQKEASDIPFKFELLMFS